MPKLAYPELVKEMSQHVKVIWFNKEFSHSNDPWKELSKHSIRTGCLINVEEILDQRGEEDAEECF